MVSYITACCVQHNLEYCLRSLHTRHTCDTLLMNGLYCIYSLHFDIFCKHYFFIYFFLRLLWYLHNYHAVFRENISSVVRFVFPQNSWWSRYSFLISILCGEKIIFVIIRGLIFPWVESFVDLLYVVFQIEFGRLTCTYTIEKQWKGGRPTLTASQRAFEMWCVQDPDAMWTHKLRNDRKKKITVLWCYAEECVYINFYGTLM